MSNNDSEESEEFKIPRDGPVLELDKSNFDAAVRTVDFLFIDFYAPQVTDPAHLSSAACVPHCCLLNQTELK
jgi:hypothetical protein